MKRAVLGALLAAVALVVLGVQPATAKLIEPPPRERAGRVVLRFAEVVPGFDSLPYADAVAADGGIGLVCRDIRVQGDAASCRRATGFSSEFQLSQAPAGTPEPPSGPPALVLDNQLGTYSSRRDWEQSQRDRFGTVARPQVRGTRAYLATSPMGYELSWVEAPNVYVTLTAPTEELAVDLAASLERVAVSDLQRLPIEVGHGRGRVDGEGNPPTSWLVIASRDERGNICPGVERGGYRLGACGAAPDRGEIAFALGTSWPSWIVGMAGRGVARVTFESGNGASYRARVGARSPVFGAAFFTMPTTTGTGPGVLTTFGGGGKVLSRCRVARVPGAAGLETR
jgi:hypothetical protein